MQITGSIKIIFETRLGLSDRKIHLKKRYAVVMYNSSFVISDKYFKLFVSMKSLRVHLLTRSESTGNNSGPIVWKQMKVNFIIASKIDVDRNIKVGTFISLCFTFVFVWIERKQKSSSCTLFFLAFSEVLRPG